MMYCKMYYMIQLLNNNRNNITICKDIISLFFIIILIYYRDNFIMTKNLLRSLKIGLRSIKEYET